MLVQILYDCEMPPHGSKLGSFAVPGAAVAAGPLEYTKVTVPSSHCTGICIPRATVREGPSKHVAVSVFGRVRARVLVPGALVFFASGHEKVEPSQGSDVSAHRSPRRQAALEALRQLGHRRVGGDGTRGRRASLPRVPPGPRHPREEEVPLATHELHQAEDDVRLRDGVGHAF